MLKTEDLYAQESRNSKKSQTRSGARVRGGGVEGPLHLQEIKFGYVTQQQVRNCLAGKGFLRLLGRRGDLVAQDDTPKSYARS